MLAEQRCPIRLKGSDTHLEGRAGIFERARLWMIDADECFACTQLFESEHLVRPCQVAARDARLLQRMEDLVAIMIPDPGIDARGDFVAVARRVVAGLKRGILRKF